LRSERRRLLQLIIDEFA